MIDLLKTEWLKIKPYRTFWILICLFAVGVGGINYISFYINHNINKVTSSVGLGTGIHPGRGEDVRSRLRDGDVSHPAARIARVGAAARDAGCDRSGREGR